MPRLPALIASKYAGDALYTAPIYTLVTPPLLPKTKPWVAARTGWMIEFTQLGDIPATLRPLLGSTFNPPSLSCYTVGPATTRTAHKLWLRRPRTG
ncbi:DUF2809 domain-containing protein [Nonomuraea angiospora]|uniref:DUF2809 domain-containing protein n=1 Tax=Nonomuraea angiospora TaxID=46172 RepID=UPI0033F787FF